MRKKIGRKYRVAESTSNINATGLGEGLDVLPVERFKTHQQSSNGQSDRRFLSKDKLGPNTTVFHRKVQFNGRDSLSRHVNHQRIVGLESGIRRGIVLRSKVSS